MIAPICPACGSTRTSIALDSRPRLYDCEDCGCEFEEDGLVILDGDDAKV